MELRPYQREAIASAMAAWKQHRSVLMVMATGLGKTVTFANIAKMAVERERRVLVVAHTQELVKQAARALERVVGCEVAIEMAEEASDEGTLLSGKPMVVVGTVQTLAAKRGSGLRCHKFRPDDFGLVIFDEAHHSVAASWRKVAAWFDQSERTKRLGVTATPDRSDGAALGSLYESCVFDYGIRDGVLDGWLCPVKQSIVYVDELDLSTIRTTAGDLNQGDLAAVLEREAVLHGMVSATAQVARGRRTLAFCATVETARHAAEILNRHEPDSAAMVSGMTPPDQRREILDSFKQGRYRYLCNCAVLTEGFDDPGIEVISMMRPTKSRSLYTQIVGRGTRTLPGVIDGLDLAAERRRAIAGSAKPSMLVLDFCGNAGRHKLVHAGDVLGGDEESTIDRLHAISDWQKQGEKRARAGDIEERDVMADIEKAEREIVERREEQKRKALRAVAKFTIAEEDPYGYGSGAIATQRTAVTVADPPSPKQIGFAAKLGVKNADRYSRRQLCAIIDKTRVPDWLRRRVGQDGIVLDPGATMRDLATAKRRAGLR